MTTVRLVPATAEDAPAGSWPAAYSEQMSLDRLLGAWDFTMHHSAMAEPVTGRQRYERVLDGRTSC
jgi:hypothetical protein